MRNLNITIVLMIFKAPVVEPADPPIKNKTNTSILENGGQAPKFSVVNPVVVNSDVAVKIE